LSNVHSFAPGVISVDVNKIISTILHPIPPIAGIAAEIGESDANRKAWRISRICAIPFPDLRTGWMSHAGRREFILKKSITYIVATGWHGVCYVWKNNPERGVAVFDATKYSVQIS
jgi:hypothetical protein